MSFSSDEGLIINQLPQTVNLPDIEDKQNFTDKIESIFKQVADTVNGKEEGLYSLEERGSGGLFYAKNNEDPLRNVYRKTIDFLALSGGSILGLATIQFTHEITNPIESAGIFAHCTSVDGTMFTAVFPDLRMDRTIVIFTNPIDQALIQCDIVLNFLKN